MQSNKTLARIEALTNSFERTKHLATRTEIESCWREESKSPNTLAKIKQDIPQERTNKQKQKQLYSRLEQDTERRRQKAKQQRQQRQVIQYKDDHVLIKRKPTSKRIKDDHVPIKRKPTSKKSQSVVQRVKILIKSQGRALDGQIITSTTTLFNLIDKSNNGTISLIELNEALHRLDVGFKRERIKDLCDKIESNHPNKNINLQEFVSIFGSSSDKIHTRLHRTQTVVSLRRTQISNATNKTIKKLERLSSKKKMRRTQSVSVNGTTSNVSSFKSSPSFSFASSPSRPQRPQRPQRPLVNNTVTTADDVHTFTLNDVDGEKSSVLSPPPPLPIHERLYNSTTRSEAIERAIQKVEQEKLSKRSFTLKKIATDPNIHVRLHSQHQERINYREGLAADGTFSRSDDAMECTFSPKIKKPSRSYHRAQKKHKIFKHARIIQRWYKSKICLLNFHSICNAIVTIQNNFRRSGNWRRYCLEKLKKEMAVTVLQKRRRGSYVRNKILPRIAQRLKHHASSMQLVIEWNERKDMQQALLKWINVTLFYRNRLIRLAKIIRVATLCEAQWKKEFVMERWKEEISNRKYQRNQMKIVIDRMTKWRIEELKLFFNQLIQGIQIEKVLRQQKIDTMENVLIGRFVWEEYYDLNYGMEIWKKHCGGMIAVEKEKEIKVEIEKERLHKEEMVRLEIENKKKSIWMTIHCCLMVMFVVWLGVLCVNGGMDGGEVLPEM